MFVHDRDQRSPHPFDPSHLALLPNLLQSPRRGHRLSRSLTAGFSTRFLVRPFIIAYDALSGNCPVALEILLLFLDPIQVTKGVVWECISHFYASFYLRRYEYFLLPWRIREPSPFLFNDCCFSV